MTHKIFWTNPYQTELTTTITAVQGPIVTVAETIFYALNGGQESDSGTIGGYPVLLAEKDDTAIYYTLPADHQLQVGDVVLMTIDWPRRYRLMRLHFAAEIVLALVYQHIPTIERIGAHIAVDKSRIDFMWDTSLSPLLPLLTEQAHALIAAAEPITSAFSDVASERRYWAIEGFGKVACGGTHPRHTGEVGSLLLKRKNVGKNKERIEIYLQDTP